MSTNKQCPHCGTKAADSDIFCKECGYNFGSYSGSVRYSPQPNANYTTQQSSPYVTSVSGPEFPGACTKCKMLYRAGTPRCLRCGGPLKLIIDAPPGTSSIIPAYGLDMSQVKSSSAMGAGCNCGTWVARIVISLVLSAIVGVLAAIFG